LQGDRIAAGRPIEVLRVAARPGASHRGIVDLDLLAGIRRQPRRRACPIDDLPPDQLPAGELYAPLFAACLESLLEVSGPPAPVRSEEGGDRDQRAPHPTLGAAHQADLDPSAAPLQDLDHAMGVQNAEGRLGREGSVVQLESGAGYEAAQLSDRLA
jgi:hypothetical protein